MQKGKKLEAMFQKEMKNRDIYFKRFHDSKAGGLGVVNPADFFIFTGEKYILVECKESKKHILYFDKIQPSQYKGYLEVKNLKNAAYYVIILHSNQLYICNMSYIMDKVKAGGKGVYISLLKQITWDKFVEEYVK